MSCQLRHPGGRLRVIRAPLQPRQPPSLQWEEQQLSDPEGETDRAVRPRVVQGGARSAPLLRWQRQQRPPTYPLPMQRCAHSAPPSFHHLLLLLLSLLFLAASTSLLRRLPSHMVLVIPLGFDRNPIPYDHPHSLGLLQPQP